MTRVWFEWTQDVSAEAEKAGWAWSRSLPWWHFAMVADEARNAAFDKAITSAVKRIHAQQQECRVFDVGCGSGLLSMMARRAGAEYAWGKIFLELLLS
jgi:2-polyprenyl-3-methyl-5-hydroxy-6-metoxy-1,4-benzoquinol methylase